MCIQNTYIMKLVSRKELDQPLIELEKQLLNDGFEVITSSEFTNATALYKKDKKVIHVVRESNVLYMDEMQEGEETEIETELVDSFENFEKSLEGLNALQKNAAFKTKYKELGGEHKLTKTTELVDGVKTLLA
jgi:hypothetical protein